MISAGAGTFNPAMFLTRAVEAHPEQRALLWRDGRGYASLTFRELEARVDGLARALARGGVKRGMRVLVMLRGADFVAVTFAVFKLGAVPALIDPGMGLKGVLGCIRHLEPEVLVGVPPVMLIGAFFSRSFTAVRHRFVVGWFPGTPSLVPESGPPVPTAQTDLDETAAVLFTSGSTGPAKGVMYRHRIFQAQVEALRAMYDFVPGDIDVPGFPLFALFSTALGQTCLLPDLDPSRPATVDPKKVVDAVREFGAHSLQGSPAIWRRVGDYCRENGIRLPTVKRVLTFGAPIGVDLLSTWRDILAPGAQVHTPYGATESLPVATIGSDEVLGHTAAATAHGAGTCVGTLAPGIEVRIIRITDDPIAEWSDDLMLRPGEVGEITVSGDVVTWSYDRKPEATASAKIRQGERVWHRMGDLGYRDERGRLWFCGRKAHRIEGDGQRWFSVNGEEMVNVHAMVARSALVGVGPMGRQEPVLVIEPRGSQSREARETLRREALALLHADARYAPVKRVLFHPSFPVDPRHNAKIHREELAAWAAGQP